MTIRVVDTSVIMAVLLDENGAEAAARLVPDALLSSVNLAEILTKCMEMDVPPELAQDYIRNSNVEIVDFDDDIASLSAELSRLAKKGILSLGDRACIATAMKNNATALTADRTWSTLDLPCKIELIR